MFEEAKTTTGQICSEALDVSTYFIFSNPPHSPCLPHLLVIVAAAAAAAAAIFAVVVNAGIQRR